MNDINNTNEIKKEEKILEVNDKNANAKIRFKEKRQERKKYRNERKLQSHIKSAENSIYKALKDSDLEITQLLEDIALEIKNNEGSGELILYKAFSILDEIYLMAQLKILMAKNDFITNLQDDLEANLEFADFEENIVCLKEKSDNVICTLEEKITNEKEELKKNIVMADFH